MLYNDRPLAKLHCDCRLQSLRWHCVLHVSMHECCLADSCLANQHDFNHLPECFHFRRLALFLWWRPQLEFSFIIGGWCRIMLHLLIEGEFTLSLYFLWKLKLILHFLFITLSWLSIIVSNLNSNQKWQWRMVTRSWKAAWTNSTRREPNWRMPNRHSLQSYNRRRTNWNRSQISSRHSRQEKMNSTVSNYSNNWNLTCAQSV